MDIPGIIGFCLEKGVSLITCSDVYPGTIGKLLAIKKVRSPESFIKDLNEYVDGLAENKAG